MKIVRNFLRKTLSNDRDLRLNPQMQGNENQLQFKSFFGTLIHMKIPILTVYVLTLLPAVGIAAQEAQNKAYVQDGKIVVETKDGVKSLDYSDRNGFTSRDVTKWKTREEVSPVTKALDVFKDKTKNYYHKRVWFVDDGTGQDQFYVEYNTDDPNASPYLSPYYKYAYYVGYSPAGNLGVYGVNLADDADTFFIDHSSHFNLVTCDKKSSYLVVQDDNGARQILVYEPAGNKTDTTFTFGTTLEEIQKSLCP